MRKHWARFVKTWFNQPARKLRRSQARAAKAASIFPRPLEKLRPIVHCSTRRYAGKIRYGRGFTLQEIRQAKLTPQFARTVGIAVDHRRQDTSEETLLVNVQRLENYKSKLILFPRKEGKFKKGEIADSTADKLKSAEAEKQNTSKHVINKPPRKLKEKAQKISKDQKDLKVFRKLRQLRVNKFYKGTREKRAKEQAEAAEKK